MLRRISPILLMHLAVICSLWSPWASADPPAKTVVFVVDGAGGRVPCVDRLEDLAACGCPLHVINFPWTHGYKHNLKDQTDCQHSRMEGQRLAALVTSYRAEHPDCRVCVLGYCAGCGVALAGAESMPPNTIDDIVFLAPSVSPCYDLRPALRAVRCRLTAFCSRRDFVVLGLVMHFVGTTDRRHGPAAGFVGFDPVLDGSPEDAEYEKLCERNWHLSDCVLTHFGGHFGYTRSRFISANVLPVLLGH